MKKIVILLIFVLSFCLQLESQLNEIQILLNQGRVHENRNQISQAQEIYESLYESHPTNEDVVDAYLRVLFLRSNFETARSVINNSRNRLSAQFIVKQEITLLIRTSQVEEAERLALDWLSRNRRNSNTFSEFARIFEIATLFDTAITIYLQGREALNNQNLFTLELSNAYYFLRNPELFFTEGIKYLRTNPGFLYFYRNRFTEFLSENPESIKVIERLIDENDNDQILELYAFSLVEIKDFQKAADIFMRLPVANMIRFADDLKTDNQLQFALDTYQRALGRVESPLEIADLQFKIAEIYFEQNDLDNCIIILTEIINNENLHSNQVRNRTRVNTQARLLMALISMQQEADLEETKAWFEAASNFAVNQNERADILFRLSRFLYLQEEYIQAYSVIEQAIQGQRSNTSIYRMSYFPRYEIALFQNSVERDSLLTECIIHFPEDPRITEMLFLETFLNGLDGENKALFLQALRYKGLYRDSLAVSTMYDLAEKSNIEELYILAFEWAIAAHKVEYVELIQNHNFRNSVLRDFVFLHAVRQTDDIEDRRQKISDFLNHNPQNVFSPHLRLILMRANI